MRGECRCCGAPIAVRYPLVEALVGFLFLGVYLVDVIAGPPGDWGQVPVFQLVAAAYHAVFLALLVAATFIDYDLMIIPDQITVTGMVVGVGMGTLWPQVRPAPASWPRITHFQGFWVGVLGLVVGVGLTQFVRKSAGFVLRREAMGFGDVTLMGMIGAFLGWQAAVLTFFLAPFFGIGTRGMEVVEVLEKTDHRRPIIRRPIAKFLLGHTLAWPPRLCFFSGNGSGRSGIGVSSTRFT